MEDHPGGGRWGSSSLELFMSDQKARRRTSMPRRGTAARIIRRRAPMSLAEARGLRTIAVVAAMALLALMLLPPSSRVLVGSPEEETDSGQTSSPRVATQGVRYPATADFVENKGQVHRPDIFFYSTSGDVRVGSGGRCTL